VEYTPSEPCPKKGCKSEDTRGLTPYRARCCACGEEYAVACTERERPVRRPTPVASTRRQRWLDIIAEATVAFERECSGISHLAQRGARLPESWWHFGLVSQLVRPPHDFRLGSLSDEVATLACEQQLHWSVEGRKRARRVKTLKKDPKSKQVDLLLREPGKPWNLVELKRGTLSKSGTFKPLVQLQQDLAYLSLLSEARNHSWHAKPSSLGNDAWVIALVYASRLPPDVARLFGKLASRAEVRRLDFGPTAQVEAALAHFKAQPSDSRTGGR
jgi:hypothetical protein